MCDACWAEYGRPAMVSANIRQAAAAITVLYAMRDGEAGGHLHIIVDDWNVRDSDLLFCADYTESGPPLGGDRGEEFRALERYILELLESMTEIERVTTLALADGFFTPDDDTGTSST